MNRRVLISIATVCLPAAALAFATFSGVFNKHYKVAKGSAIATAKCAVCHKTAKGGKLNAYGADLKRALKGGMKLTPAVLDAAGGMDSNRNGVKNAPEVRSGKLPG